MGAIIKDESKAIEQLNKMPEDVKEVLAHHLRNCLSGILGGAQANRLDIVEDSARHLKEDLERFGL